MDTWHNEKAKQNKSKHNKKVLLVFEIFPILIINNLFVR